MAKLQATSIKGKKTCFQLTIIYAHKSAVVTLENGENTIGNAVSFNFRAVLFDELTVLDRDYSNLRQLLPIQIYVSLKSIDKNAHPVMITSEALKLKRYCRVEAQGGQGWRLLSKNDVQMTYKFGGSSCNFDMEVVLADVVNERATDLLALSLYEDEETTDVELVGADGKELRAHGYVLSKASPFLRAAFYGGLKEAHEKRLVVPDADQAALKLVKKFAYTGAIDAEPAALATLLPIAHRFQMPDLAEACAGLLAESLPANELISMLDLQPTEILLIKAMVKVFGPETFVEELLIENAEKANEP